MNVAYINPMIRATTKVFGTMLNCRLQRRALLKTKGLQPYHEVSGIIELSGKARGAVVLSMPREIALRITEALLNERVDAVDAQVLDAVGELTNIIAGNAKAELEDLQLRVSLPRIVVGKNHMLPLEYERAPIDIVFDCEWGTIVVQVGLVEDPTIC